MADQITIARPYAKAVFETALKANELASWSNQLALFCQLVSDETVKSFINNPATTTEQKVKLLLSISEQYHAKQNNIVNLLTLLAENHRLILLPEMYLLFEEMRAEEEKTLEVLVTSFSELSPDQEQKMTQALSERLNKNVKLKVIIDQTLIGGAVIHAGNDLIIDGSIRGKLNSMRTSLAA